MAMLHDITLASFTNQTTFTGAQTTTECYVHVRLARRGIFFSFLAQACNCCRVEEGEDVMSIQFMEAA